MCTIHQRCAQVHWSGAQVHWRALKDNGGGLGQDKQYFSSKFRELEAKIMHVGSDFELTRWLGGHTASRGAVVALFWEVTHTASVF